MNLLDGPVFPWSCWRFLKREQETKREKPERKKVKLETTGETKIAVVCFESPTRDHRLSRKKNQTNYYSSREKRKRRKEKKRNENTAEDENEDEDAEEEEEVRLERKQSARISI